MAAGDRLRRRHPFSVDRSRAQIRHPFPGAGPKDPAAVGGEWRDVSRNGIDPGVAYRYFHRDGSKRYIDLFFYDPGISRGIAFEGALVTSQALVDRIARTVKGEGRIVHAATDGESYGHHTKFGDLSLAYALKVEAANRDYWVTNYGAYLEKYPPAQEVEIKKGEDGLGTSWSCAHGVGRWFRDCGCQTGGQEGWNQAWRGPLRKAFDYIRDQGARFFEEERGKLFQDPWAVRNDYIQLVLDPLASRESFLETHAGRGLSSTDQMRALAHLEIQRNAMLMYTSCGWFFSEISGIEGIQVMKYATRIFDLMRILGLPAPENEFLRILGEAKSNFPEFGNGADVYRRFAEPSRVTPQGVVAHLALSSLVSSVPEEGEAGGYFYEMTDPVREQRGRYTLMAGQVHLKEAKVTQQFAYAFAGIHLGGIDFYGAIRPFLPPVTFQKSSRKLVEAFNILSLPKLLRLLQEEFGPEEFGVEQILPEARRKVFQEVFGSLVDRFSEQYVRLYEENRRNLEMLQSVGFELPKEIQAAAEFTFGKLFEEEIQKREWFKDPEAYQNLIELADEVTQHGYRIDRFVPQHTFRNLLTEIVDNAVAEPSEDNVKAAVAVVRITKKLGLDYNLYLAQEAVFESAEKSRDFEKLMELSDLLNLRTDLLMEKNAGIKETLRPTA